ncbi:MAG: hypothetical protein ACMG6E_07010, partial [Candidatus Roizmanbacteria bacterium]
GVVFSLVQRNVIFEIEQFKRYSGQNVSLNVLENESHIQEEEGVEEAAGSIHVNGIDVQRRAQIKDLNFAELYAAFDNGNLQEAINFFKTYKLSDLMFIRGQAD